MSITNSNDFLPSGILSMPKKKGRPKKAPKTKFNLKTFYKNKPTGNEDQYGEPIKPKLSKDASKYLAKNWFNISPFNSKLMRAGLVKDRLVYNPYTKRTKKVGGYEAAYGSQDTLNNAEAFLIASGNFGPSDVRGGYDLVNRNGVLSVVPNIAVPGRYLGQHFGNYDGWGQLREVSKTNTLGYKVIKLENKPDFKNPALGFVDKFTRPLSISELDVAVAAGKKFNDSGPGGKWGGVLERRLKPSGQRITNTAGMSFWASEPWNATGGSFVKADYTYEENVPPKYSTTPRAFTPVVLAQLLFEYIRKETTDITDTNLLDTGFTNKNAYKVSIKFTTTNDGDGSPGTNFFGKRAFKWMPYQNFARFKKYVMKAIARLDKQLQSSPDAGEEGDEEVPDTFLEANRIKFITIAIIPEVMVGSCNATSYSSTIISNVKVISYRSTGNNCLFTSITKQNCMRKKSYPKGNEVRVMLGIERGVPVGIEHLDALADIYGVNIKCYTINDDKCEELAVGFCAKNDEVAEVLLHLGHYYHIVHKDWCGRKVKCKRCNCPIIVSNLQKHICNEGNVTFVNRYVMKDRMGKSKMRKYVDEFDGSKLKNKMNGNKKEKSVEKYPIHNLVYDFETFACAKNGNSLVYASGLYYVEEDKYFQFYGKNALKNTMDFIWKLNDEFNIGFNLISYNGAGFDHYFIYHYLLEQKYKFDSPPLINGGRILCMSFWKNRTFDLFLFACPNSLDSLLKGFKVKEIAKGVFPHLYPKKWADVKFKGHMARNYYPKRMLMKVDDPKCEWAVIPEFFDFKKECLKYLRSDVLGLYAVYEKMRVELLNITGVDFRSYLTISQMSYDFNCSLMNKDDTAELPQDRDVYDMIDKTIYGGRTTPIKLRFTNEYLKNRFIKCKGNQSKLKKLIKKIVKKRVEFESRIEAGEDWDELVYEYKKWEYLIPFDVKSLYPTTYSKPFPAGKGKMMTGEEFWANRHMLMSQRGNVYKRMYLDTNRKVKYQKGTYAWGIYEVDIISIPKHIVPLLPQKDEITEGTVWDLIPRKSQMYNTIDLEEAERVGYKFVIKRAFVYKMAKCLLNDFVQKVYAIKKEQDMFKNSDDPALKAKYNPAKRMTIKIMLNSLYGKMIQRPVLESSVIIDSFESSVEFHKKYDWSGFELVGDDKILMTGLIKDFEGVCSKPVQVGSFILSYSRVIMREYMDMVDEYRWIDNEKSMKRSFYYTDTDCIWISSFQRYLLAHRIGEELGDVEDELEGGICYDTYFICPKVYLASYYIDYGDKVVKKTKMRAKGHPSYCLKPEYFKTCWEEGSVKTDEFMMLKKLRFKLTNKEKEEGHTEISIRKLDCRRRLNRDTWNGRTKLVNGDTYPLGFFDLQEQNQLDLFQEEVESEEEEISLGQLTDTPT